jgi:hypothetical protein
VLNLCTLDVTGEWLPKNTDLVRLESLMNYVPPVDGSDGGIQPMEERRILFANRMGEFGVIETNGIVNLLRFKIEINLDALK